MEKWCSERGIGTIEVLVVFSLLGFALMGFVGLHMVAISAGNAAGTSSIATNLARARMEELLSLPQAEMLRQDNAEVSEQIPPGQGPTYTVHTSVNGSDPARLDVLVTVAWRVPLGPACASGSQGGCAGGGRMFTRTLETRIKRP